MSNNYIILGILKQQNINLRINRIVSKIYNLQIFAELDVFW